MKILITGGRDFDNHSLMIKAMMPYFLNHDITHIIHGAAKGADSLAAFMAREWGIDAIACPADWQKNGRAAGPIRNKHMLETYKPDLVIAFPGGRGTANMVEQAIKAGVEVKIIEDE